MHKLLIIIGNRPHVIKAAPLIKELNLNNDVLEYKILHTGQHYDALLSDIFFNELSVPKPDKNLDVGSLSAAIQMANMVIGIDQYIKEIKPDLVIVFGDTNSTAAGALASAKNNIPVAHIEAGLREFDLSIPEEVNKKIIDSISTLFFAPTKTGVSNLQKEGVSSNLHLVGDIGLDLLRLFNTEIDAKKDVFENLGLRKKEYIFLTCHRAVNTGSKERLINIIKAGNDLEYPIVFPVHPRTKSAIKEYGLMDLFNKNWHSILPIGFLETQFLIKHAHCVMTDSGGIIKEAYYHNTPGIIIDNQTEWTETLDEKWNVVAGADSNKIKEVFQELRKPNGNLMQLGDGFAAQKIVRIIHDYLNKN